MGEHTSFTCLMAPFSRCFFIAFFMRNFFLSSSISGYFFIMYFMIDWYVKPDLSLQDCKEREIIKTNQETICASSHDSGHTHTHRDGFHQDVIHSVLSA